MPVGRVPVVAEQVGEGPWAGLRQCVGRLLTVGAQQVPSAWRAWPYSFG